MKKIFHLNLDVFHHWCFSPITQSHNHTKNNILKAECERVLFATEYWNRKDPFALDHSLETSHTNLIYLRNKTSVPVFYRGNKVWVW